jgi:hypothetical protein
MLIDFLPGQVDRGLFYWPNFQGNSVVQLRRRMSYSYYVWLFGGKTTVWTPEFPDLVKPIE